MAKEYSRTQRIGDQMQRELAQLIRREVKDPRVGLVTITAVEVSRDVGHAKIFITVMGQDRAEEIAQSIKVLNSAAGFLRMQLAREMKLRSVPQLHFHYDEAVFALTVPKVMQDGPAIQDNLVGPTLDNRFCWDNISSSWIECATAPDTDWNSTIAENQDLTTAFQSLQDVNNSLYIERAVSLSCGPNTIRENWHRVDNLDACQIGENEVVNRITLRLDRDIEANNARHQRINRVASLNHILANEQLPLPINDLSDGGAVVIWNPNSPNTNIFKQGMRPALVAYLGDAPPPEVIRNIGEAAFELLRRENAEHKNRVAVCFRTVTGMIKFADIKPLTDITYDGSSMVSITEAD